MNATPNTRRSRPVIIASIVLLIIAAAWLIVSFLSLRALVAGIVKENPNAIATLISALSGAIIGAVFGGAAAGHLARISGLPYLARLPRLVVGSGAGVLVGIGCSALAYYTFNDSPAVAAIVAGVAGISAIVGGCLAAPRNSDTVFAGLCATLVVLVAMFARGWFATEIGSLMTPDAYRWIGIVSGLVLGMVVGLAAVAVLRYRSPKATLYGYLAAGAAPGALWLVSEIATRVAAGLLTANGIEPDKFSGLGMQLGLEAQLNGSLAALFTGGTTAVLAFGLLMPSKTAKRPAKASPKSKASEKSATN